MFLGELADSRSLKIWKMRLEHMQDENVQDESESKSLFKKKPKARGKRYGDICICITDSLCYKAETDTSL